VVNPLPQTVGPVPGPDLSMRSIHVTPIRALRRR